MMKSVVIDYLPESASRYRPGWAVVVVDVIRATTTAITAVATGRRCFTLPTIEAARSFAGDFDSPLLAGESAGMLPIGFEIDNSPSQLFGRADTYRPLVLVSSSGTKAIHAAMGSEAVYLACFRNYSAAAGYLANHHSRVAIIGAGTKGEFREEDQMCCGWIAKLLTTRGFVPESPLTVSTMDRWHNTPPEACLCSHSVDFLKRTSRFADLDFILTHVDDLQAVFPVRNSEVGMISKEQDSVTLPAFAADSRGWRPPIGSDA